MKHGAYASKTPALWRAVYRQGEQQSYSSDTFRGTVDEAERFFAGRNAPQGWTKSGIERVREERGAQKRLAEERAEESVQKRCPSCGRFHESKNHDLCAICAGEV